MLIQQMTPSDLARYIGPWCDTAIAAAMLQRLRDADYHRPCEVPESTWDHMLHHSVRECESLSKD